MSRSRYGVEFAYASHARQGGSTGDAVVLVHGWLGNRSYWDSQLESLTRQLDVVTVEDTARTEFREHLASWRRGALRPAQWPSRQGRHLTLRWTGFPLHLDDRFWPPQDAERSAASVRIDLHMQPGVLEFLVPPDTDHPPVP